MTDTRARKALAAAMIRSGIYFFYSDPTIGLDKPDLYAEAILSDKDITPAERAALAAAFLDAETLAAALRRIYWAEKDDDQTELAAAILAALRETP